MQRITLLIILLGFLLGFPTQAIDGQTARSTHKIGVTAALVEPYPSLIGLNIGYNFLTLARAMVGYGIANSGGSSLSTTAIGVRIFYPNWTIAPFLSLNMGFTNHFGTGRILGVTTDMSHCYSDLGVEFMDESGVTMGLAYKIPWTGTIRAMPSLYFGWFFTL